MKEKPLEKSITGLVKEGAKRFNNIIISDILRYEAAPGVLAKIRVIMVDGSFLDIYWSPSGKYSLHYERRHINGKIYRHDNAPHPQRSHVRTFPKHYHSGSEDNVVESLLPGEPVRAVEEFLKTIREIMGTGRRRRERLLRDNYEIKAENVPRGL